MNELMNCIFVAMYYLIVFYLCICFQKTLDDTDALTQNPLFMTPESYSSYDTGTFSVVNKYLYSIINGFNYYLIPGIYNDGNPVDIVIQDPVSLNFIIDICYFLLLFNCSVFDSKYKSRMEHY